MKYTIELNDSELSLLKALVNQEYIRVKSKDKKIFNTSSAETDLLLIQGKLQNIIPFAKKITE